MSLIDNLVKLLEYINNSLKTKDSEKMRLVTVFTHMHIVNEIFGTLPGIMHIPERLKKSANIFI